MFLLLKSCISTLILICYILMYNVIVLPGSRGHYYLLSHPWHTCYSPIPWKQLDIIQPNFHKFFCKTWCLTCYFCPAWFFGGGFPFHIHLYYLETAGDEVFPWKTNTFYSYLSQFIIIQNLARKKERSWPLIFCLILSFRTKILYCWLHTLMST